MFSPVGEDLERGWPGLIEGDTVIQLAAQTLQSFFSGGGGARHHAEYPLAEVELRAPVLHPPSVRDFYAFEQHVKTAREARGAEVPKEWYEIPVFYFSNPAAIYGPGADVPYPEGTEELDYELEVAAIIGAEGRIGGFTVMNDWSARDLQRAEMRVGLGPAKGKDFATSLGPVVVTPDEFDGSSAEMVARVNGEERSRGNLRDLFHTWEAIVAHAAPEHRAAAGRRPRLRHGRHRLHPRARRRALAAARRHGRARGGGDRRAAEHRGLVEVAVVGAGINGVAVAYALACGGDEVTLYEQFRLGHGLGSSHGTSRIFRLAYPEPQWVQLAQEALPAWRELEADCGETLLELDGLVELAPPGVEGSRAALEACGARFEELEVPGFDGAALLQPDAGIVRADLAHRAFLEGALRRGARLVEDAWIERLDALDAEVVVVTAGAWVRRLAARPAGPPDAGDRLLLPAGRRRARIDRARHRARRGLLRASRPRRRAQGRPAPLGAGGRSRRRRRADPEIVALLSDWVERRFPGVDPEPERIDTCLYTNAPGEQFLLERRGRVVVGSACSGHAFKFAPVIGARLASLARG